MPGGMDGVELAKIAAELQPGIEVLYTSGYGETVIKDNDANYENLRILQKLYGRAELIAKVRDSLLRTVTN